jgi:hypothetical protein
MHQIASPTVDSSRRWWVLATVVAAQFMFGVDAFGVVRLSQAEGDLEGVLTVFKPVAAGGDRDIAPARRGSAQPKAAMCRSCFMKMNGTR